MVRNSGTGEHTRVAIITDVHGNAPALRAVLSALDKGADIEHIYCLGDMIGIGHASNEVLHMLFQRSDVTMIKGNHEEAVLSFLYQKAPTSNPMEYEHHEWIARNLEPEFAAKLQDLGMSLEATLQGKHFLGVHYHLDERGRFRPIEKEPTALKFDEIYGEADVDVVCFGHHHPVHHFQSSRRIYLNPGSLGCYDHPLARYAVLDFSRGGTCVELGEVPYDNRQFLLDFERLQVPSREFILRAFYGNQQVGWK